MGLCDLHGETPGRTTGLYVTLVRDGKRLSRRRRVCGECIYEIRTTYGRQWSDGFVLTKFNSNDACVSCGELRGNEGVLHPLYATGWSDRGQRFDYYGRYCDACAPQVISSFDLINGDSDAS